MSVPKCGRPLGMALMLSLVAAPIAVDARGLTPYWCGPTYHGFGHGYGHGYGGDSQYVITFSGNDCYANLRRSAGSRPPSQGCVGLGTVQHEILHSGDCARRQGGGLGYFLGVIWSASSTRSG